MAAAAGSLVPPGAGNGGESSSAPSAPGGDAPPETKEEKKEEKSDTPNKKLQADWKGKSYAVIAAHHVSLCQAGKHDEAAHFHDAVVKTFRDKK